MTTTGAERRDTAASGRAASAGYLTALFTVASLFDRDGVAAVLALAFALLAALFWARHRFLVRRGRSASPAKGLTPRRASGNAAILLAAMAVLDGSEMLIHPGRPPGDGPAFLVASLTTAAVAAVVWFLLVRKDRHRAVPTA